MDSSINPDNSSAKTKHDGQWSTKKLPNIGKLKGFKHDINQAILIPNVDGFITASDKSLVQLWRIQAGSYSPRVNYFLDAVPKCLFYHHENRRLFAGLEDGIILEFIVSDGFDLLTMHNRVRAHQSRVTAIYYDANSEWLISIGRDNVLQYYDCLKEKTINSYLSNVQCTALAFDMEFKRAFIGDYSGQITMLKLNNTGIKVIATMKGHSESIRTLTWDASSRQLFSGSIDESITVWDINGMNGITNTFLGHKDSVNAICYAPKKRFLISGGEDMAIIFWDMNVERETPPLWAKSDICQMCSRPFFWNVRAMMNQKQFGWRQHHCRSCGRALCGACSDEISTIPVMGFERYVRVCDPCDDRWLLANPLASFRRAKHSIVCMDLDESNRKLLTVGQDRTIKIWDLSELL